MKKRAPLAAPSRPPRRGATEPSRWGRSRAASGRKGLWLIASLGLVLGSCGGEGGASLSAGAGGASGASGSAGTAGSSGGSGQAGGPGVELFPFVDAACGACVASECQQEMTDCRASTSCLAIAGCLSQCEASTPSCLVKCDNTPWRPDDVAARARACQVARCGEACSISCGGLLAKTEDCAACGPERCCAEGAACGASLACQRLDACRLLCDPTDAKCAAACDQKFPDGKSARDAYRSCLKAGCGEECARGYIVPEPLWPRHLPRCSS